MTTTASAASGLRGGQHRRVERCLVTGGAGFIGSHIVDALLARGHQVAVLDNFRSGRRENLPPDLTVYQADITGPIDEAFAAFKPSVVVHQAAQVSVSVSVRAPLDDARTNILGSISVIQAALRHGATKIVYASSGAAYGAIDRLPLRESMRALPVSAYGASKYTVEHYLKLAQREWGLRQWAALRYANVYGPRQDPHGEAGVVAIFSNKLLDGQAPTIFDDGEQTRDYVYVADVAAANVAAVERDLSGCDDPVFNISTGRETTVNALFDEISRAFSSDLRAVYGPPRPGDVRRSLLDPARARETLGFAAETDLRNGLRLTAEFFNLRARVR